MLDPTKITKIPFELLKSRYFYETYFGGQIAKLKRKRAKKLITTFFRAKEIILYSNNGH